MTRPMPGPPECYYIDWHPIWGVVWVDLLDEGDQVVNHSDLDKKRMTDAECAAEYWRAAFDCEDYSLSDGYGDGIIEPISRARWWMRDPRNNDQRKATWRRFATHPHALEES